ncbi:hypothetical protein FJY94_03955 [Candidatus Kaiserbacteria bacterium]|nr:hypothetical protein [Candidatus Kaiserbacteria bacterium]
MAKQAESKQWTGRWRLRNEKNPTPKHHGTKTVWARNKEEAKSLIAAGAAKDFFNSTTKLYADQIEVKDVREVRQDGAAA